jgi:hypothetical protein
MVQKINGDREKQSYDLAEVMGLFSLMGNPDNATNMMANLCRSHALARIILGTEHEVPMNQLWCFGGDVAIENPLSYIYDQIMSELHIASHFLGAASAVTEPASDPSPAAQSTPPASSFIDGVHAYNATDDKDHAPAPATTPTAVSTSPTIHAAYVPSCVWNDKSPLGIKGNPIPGFSGRFGEGNNLSNARIISDLKALGVNTLTLLGGDETPFDLAASLKKMLPTRECDIDPVEVTSKFRAMLTLNENKSSAIKNYSCEGIYNLMTYFGVEGLKQNDKQVKEWSRKWLFAVQQMVEKSSQSKTLLDGLDREHVFFQDLQTMVHVPCFFHGVKGLMERLFNGPKTKPKKGQTEGLPRKCGPLWPILLKVHKEWREYDAKTPDIASHGLVFIV